MTPEIDAAAEARRALEGALYECKRVVVGQDAMLERLLVALLTGGHVLLEGVPGLAKTLTVRTLATVLGGSFRRVQFPPDLVPADLVGTRIWQPGDGSFRTELGPVFANLLLADEINRAPAKVQSALLEVMQEHQVTIGGEAHRVPEPYLVLATQNPIESEGTYDLPEAQVDRFLFKLVVDYPGIEDEIAVVDRVSVATPTAHRAMDIADLVGHQQVAREVFADRSTIAYAVALVDATRHPGRHGLADLGPLIQFGASPRASLGLVQAARALALLRNRTHVVEQDIRDLAADVLRHRLVLSYDALADGVRPDELIDRLLETVTATRPLQLAGAAGSSSTHPAARGPARCPMTPSPGSISGSRAAPPGRCRASGARPAWAPAPSWRSCDPTSRATTRASSTRRRAPAPGCPTSASRFRSAR